MSVGTVLYGLLSNDPVVAALVATRIYPQVAREAATDPYIVYSTVSDVPENTFDGQDGLRHARVQIDCYSHQYDEAQVVADAVEGVLKEYKSATVASVVLMRRDLYEDVTQYHRVQLDVSFWLS